MSRKSSEPTKSRHIKYLLYEDNPKHMTVLDNIRNDKHLHIGIRHHIVDLDGNDVIEDTGKPHFHVYQAFDCPVYPSACAKRYGLIDDSGTVNVQFCRTISGSWQKALIYLTHFNTPDKELYSDRDLFGSEVLKREYADAVLAYSDKHIDVRSALYAMTYWVEHDMRGRIINSAQVIQWLITTPYIRFRNERLFHDLIRDHNQRLWQLQSREFQSLTDRGIQVDTNSLAFDFRECTDEEYQALGLGVQFDE